MSPAEAKLMQDHAAYWRAGAGFRVYITKYAAV